MLTSQHFAYRSLIEGRVGVDDKDKGRTPIHEHDVMANELSFFEGFMFIALVTAYRCGIGFPAAGLSDGPRDFDRAMEACAGGVSTE